MTAPEPPAVPDEMWWSPSRVDGPECDHAPRTGGACLPCAVKYWEAECDRLRARTHEIQAQEMAKRAKLDSEIAEWRQRYAAAREWTELEGLTAEWAEQRPSGYHPFWSMTSYNMRSTLLRLVTERDEALAEVERLRAAVVPDTGQAREPVMTETTRKLARRASQYRRETLGWLKQAIRADGEAREPRAVYQQAWCDDTSGPNGIGGACVLGPGHLHRDGLGGEWPFEPSGDTVQPVGAITIDAIAWYCDPCGALRSAPNGAIITTACVCGSSLMTGRGVGRTSGDT